MELPSIAPTELPSYRPYRAFAPMGLPSFRSYGATELPPLPSFRPAGATELSLLRSYRAAAPLGLVGVYGARWVTDATELSPRWGGGCDVGLRVIELTHGVHKEIFVFGNNALRKAEVQLYGWTKSQRISMFIASAVGAVAWYMVDLVVS